MQIISKPVKNYTKGRNGYKAEAIVIHIAEGYLTGAYSWFNNPNSKASSHFMIGKNGEVWQFVQEKDTAWHAGGVNKPSWKNLKKSINPNFYTIGIEHEGFTGDKWTYKMLESSCQLTAELCYKNGIKPNDGTIIGHNQINSVSRDRCPGKGVNLQDYINTTITYYNEKIMIDQLKEELKKAKDENTSLKSAVIEKEREINLLKSKPANNPELREEISSLQKQIQALNIEVDKLRAENLKLRKPSNSTSLLDFFRNIFK